MSLEQLSEHSWGSSRRLQSGAWTAKPRECQHLGRGGGRVWTDREGAPPSLEDTVTGAQAPFPHLQNCFTHCSTVIQEAKGRSDRLEIHPKAAIMKTLWSESEQMKQRGKKKKFPQKHPYSHLPHTPRCLLLKEPLPPHTHTHTHTHTPNPNTSPGNPMERAENRHQ